MLVEIGLKKLVRLFRFYFLLLAAKDNHSIFSKMTYFSNVLVENYSKVDNTFYV